MARQSAGRRTPRPVDRHQLLGLVAHRALEHAVDVWPDDGWTDDYEDAWSQAAMELGAEDWSRLPAAPLAYVSIRRWLLDNAESTASARAEVELATDDGLVQGRADLVVHGEDGVGVLDLKTGSRADRPLDGDVLRQLELYAAILEEAGDAVDWLGLLSATSRHDSVEHDRGASRRLLANVRAAGLAADVPTPPPGVPDLAACFTCRWLDGCDEGRGALGDMTEAVVVQRVDQSTVGPSAIVESVESREVRRVDLVDRPDEPQGRRMLLVRLDDEHRLVEEH